ncbi:MAG: hypothetical protein RI909_348 [Bacteroidota bacterium]
MGTKCDLSERVLISVEYLPGSFEKKAIRFTSIKFYPIVIHIIL